MNQTAEDQYSLGKKPIVHRCFAACTVVALWSPMFVFADEPVDELTGAEWVCTQAAERRLADAEVAVGDAGVRVAAVLPNPSLVLEQQSGLSGPVDHETVVGLSVPLGIGGRRFVLQDAAKMHAQAATLNAEASLLQNALEFRQAYVRAATDRAREEVLRQQQRSIDELSVLIEGLVRGGEAAAHDLDRQRLQSRLHQHVLALASALARASLAVLQGWLEVEFNFENVELGTLGGGSFRDAVAVNNPRIGAFAAEARAAVLEGEAAARRWVPDLDVFGGYRRVESGDETTHGLSVSVSIPITFFDHGQGEAALASATGDRAVAQQAILRRQFQSRLTALRPRLESLVAMLAAAETTAEDARASRAKSQQLYALGEATLTDLLDAFRVVGEAELARVDLAEELAIARLELMQIAGSQFSDRLDSACNVTHRSERDE